MSGPLDYGTVFGIGKPPISSSPSEDQGLDYESVFGKKKPTPQDTAQAFISDATLTPPRSGIAVPFDAGLFEQWGGTAPDSHAPPVAHTVKEAFRSFADVMAGEPNRAGRLQEEAAAYAASPEKRAADLESTASITAAPTGWEKFKQNLASVRLFTDRSLIEFDQGNTSGFSVGLPFTHPAETAKGLLLGIPHFFASLVTQPAAWITDKLQNGQYLLPEEREQYQREIMANYAGLVVGGLTGSAAKELIAGRSILKAGVEAAMKKGLPVATGELEGVGATLGRAMFLDKMTGKIAVGSLEGASGGATMGFIQGRTPEERRNLAATYAMLALPAGIVFEAAKGIISAKEPGPHAQTAYDIRQLSLIRQFQDATQANADDAAASFLNLYTAGNMEEAAQHSVYNHPVIIPRVRDLTQIGSPYFAAFRRPDGSYDVAHGVPDVGEFPPAPIARFISDEQSTVFGANPRQRALTFSVKGREVSVHFRDNGDGTAYVNWMGSTDVHSLEDVSAGIAGVRSIIQQIKERYPHIERVDYERIGIGGESRDKTRAVEPPTPRDEPIPLNQPDVTAAEQLRDAELNRIGMETKARIANARATFEVAGFFPGEHVNFLGKDYTFKDFVVDKNGNLTHHVLEAADGGEVEVPWDLTHHGSDMAVNPAVLDRPAAQQAVLDKFSLFMEKQSHDKPFDQAVIEYMNQENFHPRQYAAFRSFLSDRYSEKLLNDHLPPKEKVMYRRMVKEMNRYNEQSAHSLVDEATGNGMYIESYAGSLQVRDSQTGEKLGSFVSVPEAREFVAGVVADKMVDLTDSRSGLPPSFTKGVMAVPAPKNGPHTAPFSPLGEGKFGHLRDIFNTSRPGVHITQMRVIMTSLDNLLGTEFFAKVYHPLQVDTMRKYAAMYADMQRLAKNSRIAKGLSEDQMDQIVTALQTMHPDDMVKPDGLFPRGFNPREIEGAQWFIDNKIDIRKAWDYYRGLKRLENGRSFKMQPEEEKFAATERLKKSLNIDEAHSEAARIIGAVLAKNAPGELSIEGILRLAEAKMGGHVNPKEYMDANAFTPQMRLVHSELQSHFKDLAETFDIPEESRMGGYFSHLRNYKDDPITTDINGAPIFASELLRTGELSEYDRNPINVMARYINLGFTNRFTRESLDNAYKYINDATAKMPIAEKQFIRKLLVDNYVNELRGIPHASSSFTQRMIDSSLEKLGIKTTVNTRRDLVNTFLSLSSSALIGFRPMQGIRDFQNFNSIYFTRFGAGRTADLYTIMSKLTPQDLVAAKIISEVRIGESIPEAMAREGAIPTVGAVSVLTPQEMLANSISGKTQPYREIIQKAADAGIKWGLQHNVYQWAHAASYLESSTRALRELNNLATGVYGTADGAAAKAKAYDRLFINSYDMPVAREFDRLVSSGKFKEAADFLGRATSFETVSTFGLANHPAGWGTNTGRLFGQFGNWPVWARTTLARMLTRGTRGERARVAARFGMTQGSVFLASAALGLNLNSWYLPTAAPLASAAQHLAAAADSYDEDQTRELKGAAASVLLGVPGSALFRGGPALGLLGAAAQTGSGYGESEGVRALSQLPLLFVPGSFLARDIVRGAQMAADGENPVSSWLQAFGVRSTTDPSYLAPDGR